MTSPTLTELASRVERLTGPCRETDVLIASALVWIMPGAPTYQYQGGEYIDSGYYHHNGPPRYTASLDAAMTLAPDGYPITEFSYWPSVPKGYESERCCRLTITDLDVQGFGGRNRFKAQALTPALALTAACLRARASMEADHG